MSSGAVPRLYAAACVASLLVVSAAAVPATAQENADTTSTTEISQEDLDAAEAQVDAVQRRLDELAQQWNAARFRLETLQTDIVRTQEEILRTQADYDVVQQTVNERARIAYLGGDAGFLGVFLNADDVNDFARRVTYLSRIADTDDSDLDLLSAISTDLGAQQEALRVAQEEAIAKEDELASTEAELQALFDTSSEEYRALVAGYEEQERRRAEEAARLAAEAAARAEAEAAAAAAAAAATSTTATTATGPPATDESGSTITVTESTIAPVPQAPINGLVCPVAGPVAVANDFGAPRSGGRSHQGNDMLAARGTPTVAVADGVVERIRESALGGLSVYFLDNGGTEYYYAHLDGYGDVSEGQGVAQGTVLGYVGTTGNAPPNTPHLHFEIHPGRGPAVDPYPTLSGIC